jgi:hypothetical protein
VASSKAATRTNAVAPADWRSFMAFMVAARNAAGNVATLA